VRLEAVAVGEVLLGHRVQVSAGPSRRAQRQPLGLQRGDDLLRRIFSSSRSCTRMPSARGLVGVAGADAAAVVPI
jgi:hypothetical protein